MFSHDSSSGQYWSRANNNAEVKHFGDSPTDAKYSRLDELEIYGRENGAFQFKLEYPKVGITNIWKQTSNPVTAASRGVEGYEAISIEANSYNWGGLEYNDGYYNFIDGSVGTSQWHYSIGAYQSWGGSNTFPGAPNAVDYVKLWVKTVATFSSDCPPTPPPQPSPPPFPPGGPAFTSLAELRNAVNACLESNPVDGACIDVEANGSVYGPISMWDTSKITDMSELFSYKYYFNGDISNWDTSQVKSMRGMFYYAMNFNQEIGSWDTSSVTDMYRIFSRAFVFNTHLEKWDTSKVRNMGEMFYSASAFNKAIGNWDTSQVVSMVRMFDSASAFDQDIGSWNTEKVTDMEYVWSASAFNQDIGSWNTEKVTTMDYMFRSLLRSTRDIGSWNTEKVTYMHYMFQYASRSTKTLGVGTQESD